MAKRVKTVESKELGDPEMYASLGRQVEAIYNSFPRRVLHMLVDDGMGDKVVHTKEQLADLLRSAYDRGAKDNGDESLWTATGAYRAGRERAIQPIVHRFSGGHDDHGREAE